MSKLHLHPGAALLCLAAALLFVSACKRDSASDRASASGDRPVIGVSVLTLTHPFFQDVTDAMREEAAAEGYDIVINSCDFDAAKQKNQVSDYIVKQVDAIVLAPCDSKAVGTAISEANRAGIPVFTADIAALATGIQVVSHVATNNYEGGKLAARAVLEAIGGSGEVAIIDHPEVESVIQRTKGFMEVIDSARAAGANVEVVADLAGGGVKDKAFPVAQDILQRFPDLDAIFAINDDTALASVAAIEKAGKVGKVQVIGFDGTPEARRNIRDGRIYADVIQHPKEIGRETIEAIAHYMAGEPVTPETLIPATLYRQADARQDPVLLEASAATK
ncbi:MAG TPA: substrate-binding domain-containing protein [Rhodothermales bacterium]|nr:substrate-binding domain-containing protein [Rhodothermales bacterium]